MITADQGFIRGLHFGVTLYTKEVREPTRLMDLKSFKMVAAEALLFIILERLHRIKIALDSIAVALILLTVAPVRFWMLRSTINMLGGKRVQGRTLSSVLILT